MLLACHATLRRRVSARRCLLQPGAALRTYSSITHRAWRRTGRASESGTLGACMARKGRHFERVHFAFVLLTARERGHGRRGYAAHSNKRAGGKEYKVFVYVWAWFNCRDMLACKSSSIGKLWVRKLVSAGREGSAAGRQRITPCVWAAPPAALPDHRLPPPRVQCWQCAAVTQTLPLPGHSAGAARRREGNLLLDAEAAEAGMVSRYSLEACSCRREWA